jgi:hypothetical protein
VGLQDKSSAIGFTLAYLGVGDQSRFVYDVAYAVILSRRDYGRQMAIHRVSEQASGE